MQLQKDKEGRIQTEIRKLPIDWEVKQLKEVADLIVPMRDKPKKFDGNIPWIRIEDLDGKFVSGSKSNQKISEETIKKMNLKPYPVGTVLCSCSGNMGICAITKSILLSNQTFIGIVPHQKYYSDYLYYYLSFNKSKLENIGTGTTIHYIPRERFEQLKLSLPPSHEQQKISSILSRIDDLIHKTDQVIEQTQRLKKGLMQKLLTKGIGHSKFKQVSVGEIPEGWEVISLSELCNIRKSNEVSSDLYIGLEHIGQGNNNLVSRGNPKDYTSNKHVFCTGDVLYGKLRPLLNKVYLAEEDGCCSTDILPLATKERILGKILVWIMSGHRFVHYADSTSSGTKMPRTNWNDIKNFKIALPPLHEQEKIVSIISNIIKKAEQDQISLSHFENLKKGLMQKLLTGQIRVKV
jgi:type I restriction enzyme, S subunit